MGVLKFDTLETCNSELKEINSLPLNGFSKAEKSRISAKKQYLKRKIEQFESHANINIIDKVETPQENLIINDDTLSLVEEFKRLEKRRIQILGEVNQFNEYLESLKISLV